MRVLYRTLFILGLSLILPVRALAALGEAAYISNSASEGALPLVHGEQLASLYIDEDSDSAMQLALANLAADIERVTGRHPVVVNRLEKLGENAVIVGQIGESAIIDRLIAEQQLDVSAIEGVWEGYLIQTLDDPLPGVEKALVIAGSDRRGGAYGIYDVSEQIGVSPWHWWADVPVTRADSLFVNAGARILDAPRVKYRGIFLNDEWPALTNWVQEKFGDFNHQFYERVFELLMRLKANFLWPAMWNNAFADDDPLNLLRAHEHGIVMSTSHHEPMMRADKEWNRYGKGPWEYSTNAENLYRFWEEGARRNKPYDSIYTLGMRGQEDTPMSEGDNIELLQQIVADQREILAKVFDDHDVSEVPQVWALYKEVQGFYERGMRVPEDVTLLWADDNWGNIRRLPTPEERSRTGGAGVYYHFDYVGGPRSYRWMNVTPIAKIWEQMNLADVYGADRIWITNVGDLKPMEFPTEFFLRMAWKPEAWPRERLQEFGRLWAAREFGERYAADIEALISGYTRHNGRRRPEQMGPETYSQLNYREADRISEELAQLLEKAQALYEEIPESHRDAFFQLVLHPVQAVHIIHELYNATAKNRLYAQQGRANSREYAEQAREFFAANAALNERYHSINNGKWNHMMRQTRIGYTHWNHPPADTMPLLYDYQPHAEADMGVAIEGNATAWPVPQAPMRLPEFSPYGPGSHYIDVYNRGSKPFAFTATPSHEWIRVSNTAGTIEVGERLHVSIDWTKAPVGRHRGHVFIEGTGWGGARVQVHSFQPDARTRRQVKGFVEADGHIAIEAASYSDHGPSNKGSATETRWEEIPLHGRTHSSISLFPVSDTSHTQLEKAPWVEYELYLFSEGEATVEALFAPSLNFAPDRGLRYAIALGDEKPQVVDILGDLSDSAWEKAVSDGVRKASSRHRIQPGRHKLRIYGVDPGVTLQKLVIDTGGLRDSYLGPPQSQRR